MIGYQLTIVPVSFHTHFQSQLLSNMAVKASSGFPFGSLHSFPPFFTPQPHSQTSEAQQTTWCKLILDYCQAHRKFTIDWASEEELNSDLFHNRTIDRRISSAFLKVLLSKLVSQGSAVWDLSSGGNRKAGSKPEPTKVIIYWRKPDEWGELIYQWVDGRWIAMLRHAALCADNLSALPNCRSRRRARTRAS